MQSRAIVFEEPGRLAVRPVTLAPGRGDVEVAIECSGISTGTERLLYRGAMPPFPGMGYPLVPGYESVGRVVDPGASADLSAGDRVFVPGARCFEDVRGLFGGASRHLFVPADRLTKIDDALEDQGILLALAATAHHALRIAAAPVELVVGHGILGRLIARLAVAEGHDPVVWENDDARAAGARGYRVTRAEDDDRRDYRTILDVSGDATLVDTLLGRLEHGGQIVLAGFYDRIAFGFPLAFMKEARLVASSEWRPEDMKAVLARWSAGELRLDGLITHQSTFDAATDAYVTAFEDSRCLKMLVDWRTCE